MKPEYDFSASVRGRFLRDVSRARLPSSDVNSDWIGTSGRLGKFIEQETEKSLNAYREQPRLVSEHARSEQDTSNGGYAHRQLFELVQNSADALMRSATAGSILIRLTSKFLYCADNGVPIDEHGVIGLMFDRLSNKRNTTAIGRFGRGFKSVLRVTDIPEFYSRSGSFRFDKEKAEERISSVAAAESYPALRLPQPIDWRVERDKDEDLQELMSWANNIVRLPLNKGARDDLKLQIRDFPPEFLLFVDHVRYLTLEDESDSRSFMLHHENGEFKLETDREQARWQRFDVTHQLSRSARADWHLNYDGDVVPLSWAVPLDRLDRPGHFWTFFPTDTASLVAGILNAPWKTNEDRQNLLPGPYNEELLQAAARMIARATPGLATTDDPARHLDALPRRHEAGDSKQVVLLRKHLYSFLRDAEVVPDQDANACLIRDIHYPPSELSDGTGVQALGIWATYPGRPRDWLHNTAITRNRVNRLAAINRLFPPRWNDDEHQSAPQESIAAWLESLVAGKRGDDAIHASIAAIHAAAEIPPNKITSNRVFGRIVLLANGGWEWPDPERFLIPDEPLTHLEPSGAFGLIHLHLLSDSSTLSALKKLGLKSPTLESEFKFALRSILDSRDEKREGEPYRLFWSLARLLSIDTVLDIVRNYEEGRGRKLFYTKLRVLTKAGKWTRLHSVLLPGEIVTGEDSEDAKATVDMEFHRRDESLLTSFGVVAKPNEAVDLSTEPSFDELLQHNRNRFISRPLAKNPHTNRLVFRSTLGSGPLNVLAKLSDEGRARYTNALLSLNSTYPQWTMCHETQQLVYPDIPCESLTISVLRRFGCVRVSNGAIIPIADALGSKPRSADALHVLLTHPMVEKIKEAFDLAEPTPEIHGEGDPIPLIDIWPSLKEHLPARHIRVCVVGCERILVIGRPKECLFLSPNVYLTDAVLDGRKEELQLIQRELNLELSSEQIEAIFRQETTAAIDARRAVVRRCSTDVSRLYAAVGVENLRLGLPKSLLVVLERKNPSLDSNEISEAAIATFHTDALRQYKWALEPLDPPVQWAGSPRALTFVKSLGFSPEWAGVRNPSLPPFVEVTGRYRLPALHDYQKVVVRNLRAMLRAARLGAEVRRGMISLPTGSGKTRVAVQGIVEAIRRGEFSGGVLWVADRSELCEQAIEAWRQVWSSIGPPETHLRISRMWDGQPRPLELTELHVVVATIQTLHTRLSNGNREYDFLRDFKLVVFDEAHRSIAATFTSAMEEIGLTRRQDAGEPILLGLSATPYRGHDEAETQRLVSRYSRNRLDEGAFENSEPQNVIRELQSMKVLAQSDHEEIEGETFSLEDVLDRTTHSEDWRVQLEKWRALPWLPQHVEDRIAQSPERTERIVEAYFEHIEPSWSTLVFATSVDHAKTVAALLNWRGIKSRAVSGLMETSTRSQVVEAFRSGEIKALVNYGVFREGFDAPKTRAIIVARPVYSPNLYFQMIGRGLRGPLNGGVERCLILNVRDNIDKFDRSLAYSELDWLWT